MRKTKPIKVRIDNRLLEWLQFQGFKVNTAINIAVERWIYYEQHDRVAIWVIRDVTIRNSRLKYEWGATHTSVRLNEQWIEYIGMRGYVMARVIHNALKTLKNDVEAQLVDGDVLDELQSGNSGRRGYRVSCTHNKAAEPQAIEEQKSCDNCMYGIRCKDGDYDCSKGIKGSKIVKIKYNAKCWVSDGSLRNA